jgi:GH15 family glucan-1,4-alpha-glucosidase
MMAYPAIERLGVTGDRRTAVTVAANGTVNWLCLPNFDGNSLFGALLDHERGGFWRWVRWLPDVGAQRYLDRTPALVTQWEDRDGSWSSPI